jgi:hypothetical protein
MPGVEDVRLRAESESVDVESGRFVAGAGEGIGSRSFGVRFAIEDGEYGLLGLMNGSFGLTPETGGVRLRPGLAHTPPRQVPRCRQPKHLPLPLLALLFPIALNADPIPPDTYSRTQCNRILSRPHSWSICDYHEEKRLEHVIRRLKDKNLELFEPAPEIPDTGPDDDLDINDF